MVKARVKLREAKQKGAATTPRQPRLGINDEFRPFSVIEDLDTIRRPNPISLTINPIGGGKRL